MLFCSSVAIDGSVMFDGAEVENAELRGCRRPHSCCTAMTLPTANSAEARAITSIWRPGILYIKLSFSFEMLNFLESPCFICISLSLRLRNRQLQNARAVRHVRVSCGDRDRNPNAKTAAEDC